MKKYLQLYKTYLAMAFKSKLSYKADSIISLFSFIIVNGITLLTLQLTIQNLTNFGADWSFKQIAFLYGLCLIPKAIDHVFSDHLWYLSASFVRLGSLDQWLTRPVNVLFQIVASDFKWDGLGELIVGVVFIALFGSQVGVTWNIINVMILVICEFFAIFFFFAIKLICASIAFWTKRSIEFMNAVYSFSTFTMYPITIMGNVIKTIMFVLIPFGTILFLPFFAIYLGAFNIWLALVIVIAVTILFLFFGYWLFKRGLRKYESAGS